MPTISTQNPRKAYVKTVLLINNETSRDVTVFCPGCKTLETLSLNGEVMAPNRRFTQKASASVSHLRLGFTLPPVQSELQFSPALRRRISR